MHPISSLIIPINEPLTEYRIGSFLSKHVFSGTVAKEKVPLEQFWIFCRGKNNFCDQIESDFDLIKILSADLLKSKSSFILIPASFQLPT